ncbi:MAG: hypothetical protein QXF14_03655, partial [Candidatus Woesearchaeota archaeon]
MYAKNALKNSAGYIRMSMLPSGNIQLPCGKKILWNRANTASKGTKAQDIASKINIKNPFLKTSPVSAFVIKARKIISNASEIHLSSEITCFTSARCAFSFAPNMP